MMKQENKADAAEKLNFEPQKIQLEATTVLTAEHTQKIFLSGGE